MTVQRLFEELVTAVEAADPGGLHRPHRVAELQHGLVPYQRVRDALSLECSEDHEALLLRLCAGEGGYVTVESAEALETFEREAGSDNPDLYVLTTYRDAPVRLHPERRAGFADVGAATDAYRPPEDVPAVEAEEPPVIPLDKAREPELPAPPPIPEPTLEPEPPARPPAPDPAFEIALDPAPSQEQATGALTCAECGKALPTHRAVKFCPHCGHGTSPDRCGRCQAPLEPGWRHCVECGHAAS